MAIIFSNSYQFRLHRNDVDCWLLTVDCESNNWKLRLDRCRLVTIIHELPSNLSPDDAAGNDMKPLINLAFNWVSIPLASPVSRDERSDSSPGRGGRGGIEQLIGRRYTNTTFDVMLSRTRARRHVLRCLIVFFTNPLMLIQWCIFGTVIWQPYVMTVS